jgi:hypothetical protein
MANDSQRDKARAVFGKTFFANTKAQAPAKNEAVALQKRANARPIPTYKVGGVVKKPTPPGPTAAEREEARRQNESLKKAKVTPKEGKVIDSANRSEGMYKKGGKAGCYAEGGRMKGSTDAARMKGSTDAARIPVTLNEKRKKISLNEKRVPVTLNEKRVRVPSIEYKEGGRANEDFTGLMKKAVSRAAAKGNPVMKQGGATNEYIAKRVNARIEAGNYKKGGKVVRKMDGGMPSDMAASKASMGGYADGGRAKDRMEERMRKAEMKYKVALAKGSNEGIAKAKFERRNADIADDYAKKTKADRTGTKAAEQAAKAALKEARRTGGASIAKRDFDAGMMEKSAGELKQFSAGKTKMPDVSETLKGVGGLGAMPSAAAPKKRAAPVRQAPVVRQARPAAAAAPASARPAAARPAAARPAAPAPSGVNAAFFKPKGGSPTGVSGAKGLKLTAPAPEPVKPGVAAKAASDASRVARLANVRGRSTIVAEEPNIPEAKNLGSKKPNWGKYMMGAQASGVPVKRAAGGAGKVRKGMMKGC